MNPNNGWRAPFLLFSIGVAIRLPILAVPPLLPYLTRDLNLSGTELGLLSGIPMIVLALFALPGSAFVQFIGTSNTLFLGLLVVVAGSSSRGFTFSTPMLFLATALMSTGIAIVQPALSAVSRQWLPTRIGFATSIYSIGMVVGCIIPAGLTVPFVMPLVNGSWQWCLVTWTLPTLFTAVLLYGFSPSTSQPATIHSATRTSVKLNYGLIWRIGLIFGANNCVYFGTNAFIPPLLIKAGRTELVTHALTAYNTTQLFGAIAILLVSRYIERRRWPYVVAGIGILINLAWLAYSDGESTIYAASILGFFSGITLTTGLMLPPLMFESSSVARASAAMFTISYTIAMIGSVVGGIAWDFFGHPRFAIAVLALCALPLVLVAPSLRFPQKTA